VLDWVKANFDGPDNVLMTGCSAGAYGSILWAPEMIEAYPNATFSQLGDSGAGVIEDDWFEESFPSSNVEGAFPSWVPGLDPAKDDIMQSDVTDLYTLIAQHYPDANFAQFNAAQDATQRFFYRAMGGVEEDWSPFMLGGISVACEDCAKP
jgi:hypothetical protein